MTYTVNSITEPNINMAEWCDENCNGDWFGTDNPNESWYFELETDAAAFKLRWI